MIKDNRNNEQIYGRNDMIMLEPNNKIYGSLGLADNYVMKTEEGTRLVLSNPKLGKFGDVLTEFNLYGRSEQFSTTGAQLFNENIEIKSRGVTIKINGSIVTFKGTVSDEDNNRVNYQKNIKLKSGKYIVSSSNKKIVADFYVRKANDESVHNNHIKIDGTEKAVYARLLFGLKPSAKGDVIDETTNIMLNDGDIALPYEPYTGGQPSPSPDYPQEIKSVVNPTVKITNEDGLKVQSVTLNNITLNAIPVASDGNVTIDGQQYIADYVDVEKGKLVRMCKYKKFLSKNIYKIGSDKSLIIFTDEIWDVEGNYTKRTFNTLCSIGIATLETVADSGWGGKGRVKIKNAQFTNADEAKNYFDNHDVYACYPIPTPEEIDLTQDQIQAFKSLVTYYPVTIIENNYNTWMKATYKSIESV